MRDVVGGSWSRPSALGRALRPDVRERDGSKAEEAQDGSSKDGGPDGDRFIIGGIDEEASAKTGGRAEGQLGDDGSNEACRRRHL